MAMDMFIQIGSLAGESKDSVHAGKIDVLAWSWGMSNSGTCHMGSGAGAGVVNVQDISFTKYIDMSTPELMLACCTGKHFTEAKLIMRKAGETPLEYLVIDLTDVLIAAVSTGGSGGEDRLTENVVLNFGKVKLVYSEQLATGAAGKTPEMTYNIAAKAAE